MCDNCQSGHNNFIDAKYPDHCKCDCHKGGLTGN